MESVLTKKKIGLIAAKYSVVAILSVFMSRAELYGIRPFGAGLFISLCLLGLPIFFTAPVYILSEIISSPDVYTLICSVICAAVVFAAMLLKTRAQKLWQYVVPIMTVVSQSGLIILHFKSNMPILSAVASVFLTLAFMYACKSGLRPVLVEKMKYKILETELVCLAALVVAASVGLSLLNIYSYPLIATVGILTVFLCSRLSGSGAGIVAAFCLGTGSALKNFNPSLIALFVFMAVITSVFSAAPRILTSLSSIIAFILFSFYFNVNFNDTAWWIIALLAGGIIYSVIPVRLLDDIKSFFFESHERAAVRYMINKSRADLGTGLLSSANIFDAMSLAMSKETETGGNLSGKLMAKSCSFCENFKKCEYDGFSKDLDDILKTTIEKGRMPVSELPPKIASSCVHLARLVSASAEIEESYKSVKIKLASDQNARKILASQLDGVGAVLRGLAYKSGEPICYDKTKERIIIEELNYCGVICAECLIAGDDIALIVRTECLDRRLIEKIVNRITKKRFTVSGIDDSILAGFCACLLSPAPKYDMVFGVASCPKKAGEKSGDTHSFIKLDSQRFLIALCDGMGSGERAEAISNTAIGLVENFYKAGFGNELVLSSVNKFLSLTCGDSFTALDICLVDLSAATADIIKLGCPATYVKRRDMIDKIEGASLPLGAVEDSSHVITRVDLSAGDTLILVSDGISDSFEGDKLAAGVLNYKTLNPQTLASGILEQTLNVNNGVPRDDSTVIAARLIRKQGV